MKLEGKNVLVTGAATGIGRAIAEAVLDAGAASITLVDRSPSVADTADELGEDALAFVADIGKEDSVKNAIAMSQELFGPLDVIVSNAGLAYGGDLETPNHIWQKIWEVNVMAHVWAMRAVLPQWLERGEGHFVSVASAAGLLTALGAGPYSVSKHAVVGLCEWVAATYGHRGINVSVVCPEGVKTDMLRQFEEHVHEELLTHNAIEPSDVADAVVKGLEDESFLILPHPQVLDYFRAKATDWDAWLGKMQETQKTLLDEN